MDPVGVRLAARQLAAEGLAGREASVAAAASLEAERKDLVLVNYLLLIMLMEQVEPTNLRVSADTSHAGTELARTPHRDAGGELAWPERDPGQRRSGGVEHAISRDRPGCRGPPRATSSLTKRLEAAARELVKWAQTWPEDPCAGPGGFPVAIGLVTAHCARDALRDARDFTSNIPGLRRTWAAPAEIVRQTHRAE